MYNVNIIIANTFFYLTAIWLVQLIYTGKGDTARVGVQSKTVRQLFTVE